MGTWSSKPFGNDEALDWLFQLTAQGDTRPLLEESLSKALETIPRDCEEAVAAAAVIAAAAHHPVRSVPAEVKSWIARTGYVPTRELAERAALALEAIQQSELADLWRESGRDASWSKAIQELLGRLRGIVKLPERTPKAPAMPRNLCKMLELYQTDPDPALRAKIRQRLEALRDPNQVDRETGYSPPLGMVAETGLLEETALLLQRGANIDGEQGGSVTNRTPLELACSGGHLQVAKLLLESGATLIREMDIDKKGFPCVSTGAPRVSTLRYAPALWSAVRRSTPEMVDFLLSQGADLRQVDLNGETLLHFAAESGNAAVIEHLLRLGLSVHQCKPHCGETPLHWAARGQSLEAARVLLAAGADPQQEDKWGAKPIDGVTNVSSELYRLLRGPGAMA